MAKGGTYNEPNLIWASAEIPGKQHTFIEFDMPVDDPRWVFGRPQNDPNGIRHFQGSGANAAFSGSIKPEEIIAVHEPWHNTYRYLKNNNMFPRVIAGEFDHLLNKNSDEAKAIRHIKSGALN